MLAHRADAAARATIWFRANTTAQYPGTVLGVPALTRKAKSPGLYFYYFSNLGYVGADDRFDRPFERHHRRRAAAAGTEHLHVGNSFVNLDEPNFPAVGRDAGPDFIERSVDALLDGGYWPYPFMSSCMRDAMETASSHLRCHMLRPKISPTHPASMAIRAL